MKFKLKMIKIFMNILDKLKRCVLNEVIDI